MYETYSFIHLNQKDKAGHTTAQKTDTKAMCNTATSACNKHKQACSVMWKLENPS